MARFKQSLSILITLLSLALSSALAGAFDAAVVGEAERAADEFRAQLTDVQKDIQLQTLTDEKLVADRTALETIRTRALEQAEALSGPSSEISEQIAKLGPAPADGQTEAETIAAQRKDLALTQQRVEAAKKQLELISVEAEQLGAGAAGLQRDRFFSRIFEPGRSVFSPDLWLDAAAGASVFATRLAALLQTWWQTVATQARPAVLLLIPAIFAFAYGAYGPIVAWLRRRFKSGPFDRTGGNLARLWRVVRATALTGLSLAVVIIAISATIDAAGFSTPRLDMLFWALARVVFETVVVAALARFVASPRQSEWRLVDLSDATAAKFSALVAAIAFVSSAEEALSQVAANLYLPFAYTIGQSTLATIIMIALMALTLVTLRSQPGLIVADKSGRQFYFRWMRLLSPVAWLILAAACVALVTGYLALGQYLVGQLYETARLVSCLYLLHRLAETAITASFDPQSRPGRYLRKQTGLGERGIERFGSGLNTAADIALVVIGVPALLLQLTLTWIDLRGAANTLLLGFHLGDVTIAPSTLLLAAAVLGAGIILTKIAVRWLDSRLLQHSRLDKGVQDSLRKAGSYTGYAVAAGFALGVAGLDFSNIAIVAGALGVGIGFGLQSIVSNFISGLILLAERPIRVGDWVSLPYGEGVVKRIKVRATEIETFDSCTIIVPNSDLITKPVNNWTHDDTMGRFLVVVGVAYSSEPDVVQKLLLDLAKSHKKTLTFPEPSVVLAAFGPYSMNFELRGTVADVFEAALVASDIRMAILKSFRENGITIPQAPAVVSSR